ncbi:MAG TPA: hypothetical protein H9674_07385 [Firmicutes bacterium]|nr:hypothetical protein [Bacillota bacterium]
MRTGREVLYRALKLLGYTDGYGEVDGAHSAELLRRGTAAVEQILADLQRLEAPGQTEDWPADLDAPLPLSVQAVNDIMPYGVAMLLAQGEGDGDAQSLYASLYNQKRAGACRPAGRRTDVLPRLCL